MYAKEKELWGPLMAVVVVVVVASLQSPERARGFSVFGLANPKRDHRAPSDEHLADRGTAAPAAADKEPFTSHCHTQSE